MQDNISDPKKRDFRDNAADAGHSQEKQLWHAPVLQRLDVSLLTATHVTRKKGADSKLGTRS
jgi:hypothetical protein